jgi:hypothetical protein
VKSTPKTGHIIREALTALIHQLADLFPDASGRDIKGLAKLVAKYCHHKAGLITAS